MTSQSETAEIPVGMRNSLKSLRSLHGKTDENSRYFPGASVFANQYHIPYSWNNPMWDKKESPSDVPETSAYLESAFEKGYLDKAVIQFTDVKDLVGYRIKPERIAEIEKIVGGND